VERHDDNALIIYTDGSCLPNPRRGGYAYSLITEDADGEEEIFDYWPAGSLGANIGEMELSAVIEALRTATGSSSPVAQSYEKIVVYADSLYVVDHVYAAEHVWPKTGWLTSENEPVQSRELWKELIRLKRRAGRIEFRHVKGQMPSVGPSPASRAVVIRPRLPKLRSSGHSDSVALAAGGCGSPFWADISVMNFPAN
jgi:ribonuclease HI